MAHMTHQPWPVIDAKWPVIAPPKKLAELLNKVGELDTPALTAFAKEIGIQPPPVEGSDRWPVVSEVDSERRFVCLVWDDPSEDEESTDTEEADWPTASEQQGH